MKFYTAMTLEGPYNGQSAGLNGAGPDQTGLGQLTCCQPAHGGFSATIHGITDTESYRDSQQSYRAYNFLTKREIRTVLVLSRPYNQGAYGSGAGMARRPLTSAVQQQFSTDLNSALFASRPTSWPGPAE
jgi:hypothetical protein